MTDTNMEEENTQGSHLSLGELYYTLFRGKWILVTFSLLGVIAAVLVYVQTPSVYRSEAKLLVRYVTDTTVLDPTASGARILVPDARGDNIINSELEILGSRNMAEQVVNDVGLNAFPRQGTNTINRAKAVAFVSSKLQVEVPRRSNVIKLYFDAPTPELAQKSLGALIEHYLKKHVEIHRSTGAYDFLLQQTDQLKTQLATSEEELRGLKSEAGIVSVEDAKKAVASRLDEIGKAMGDAQAELAAAKARADIAAQSALLQVPLVHIQGKGSPPAADSPEALLDRLKRLQTREWELMAIYTPDSLPVQNVRALIEETRAALAAMNVPPEEGPEHQDKTGEVAVAKSHLQDPEVAGLEARIKVLEQQMEAALADTRKIETVESRIVQLERTKQIQEENYRVFSKGLEQARINDAIDAGKVTNIGIVQPATYPSVRMRPFLGRNMLIAALAGLLGGFVVAFAWDRALDRTIRRPAEIAKFLRVPLWVTIPRVALNGRRERIHEAGGVRDTATPAATGGSPLGDVLAEYIERLGDRVLRSVGDSGDGPRLIGVTSVSLGAGVSTIASGLALSLARLAEQRVLLVDADPSQSRERRIFGVSPTGAVADIFPDDQGNTAIVERNLYLLSTAKTARDVVHNLTRRIQDVVRLTQESNSRFIVFDLPPVTETSPTLRMAGLTHCMALVVASEKDTRDVTAKSIDLLRQADARVVGVVLNKVRSYIPGWLDVVA